MKSVIIIAVLAALAACYDAASVLPPYQEEIVLGEESGRLFVKDYDLEGVTGRSDVDRILFFEELVDLPAIPNTVQIRDVFYRGNSTTHINRIVISHFGEIANSHINNYHTHANIRLTTVPGRGMRTSVQLQGVYTDWV